MIALLAVQSYAYIFVHNVHRHLQQYLVQQAHWLITTSHSSLIACNILIIWVLIGTEMISKISRVSPGQKTQTCYNRKTGLPVKNLDTGHVCFPWNKYLDKFIIIVKPCSLRKRDNIYYFTGEMSLLKINPNGNTEIIDITGHQGWCISVNNQKLLVGDWNGDRLTDLLCHHQTGQMKILLNQAG